MRISSSLAAAPLLDLKQTVEELAAARVDYLHFDIEDGSFVPCMNLGTRLISELRACTRLPFDVHLMMVDPEWLIPELAAIGVDRISVHYETCPYPRRVLHKISSLGIAAGLAFNPATPVPDLHYLAPYLSFVLILSTEPEEEGAPFLPEMLQKLNAARNTRAPDAVEWVVDGGIRPENVALVAEAGADMAVVGRGLFNERGIEQNMRLLRAAFPG